MRALAGLVLVATFGVARADIPVGPPPDRNGPTQNVPESKPTGPTAETKPGGPCVLLFLGGLAIAASVLVAARGRKAVTA